MAAAAPRLSVVVAARRAGPRLERCLRATARQCAAVGAECLLVGAGKALASAPEAAPVRHVEAGPERLVPELWARGIEAAGGDVVVLTIGDCVPADGWLRAVHRVDWERVAAVGGAIELEEPARPDDRAVHALRYTEWAPPLERRRSDELAADNAAYRRDLLAGCRRLWSDGFWEPRVHEWLRSRGEVLMVEPEMVVRFRHGGGFLDMLGQRFRHGRRFAADRVRDAGVAERAARAITAPALPALLTARILADRRRRDRPVRELLPALPRLFGYLLAWSAGETAGYLRPSP